MAPIAAAKKQMPGLGPIQSAKKEAAVLPAFHAGLTAALLCS